MRLEPCGRSWLVGNLARHQGLDVLQPAAATSDSFTMTSPPLGTFRMPSRIRPEVIPDDAIPDHVSLGVDPHPLGRPQYRHKPTVTARTGQILNEHQHLRNTGGIVRWMHERDHALKERRALSINRFEMRKLEAEAKAERSRAARARREDLADRKAEMAEMAGVAAAAPVPMPDYVRRKIEEKQTAANMQDWKRSKVAERWNEFEHLSGIKADRRYAPFKESFTREDGSQVGLRSHNGSISTALFCRLLPATHRLAFGEDKEHLLRTDMYSKKIFILDSPYIELDRSRLGVLWVDLDTDWESEEHLLAALRELLGPTRMPNLISYRWSEDGTMLESPHLFWLLPPGSEVGTTGDSHMAPQFLFHDLQRRLISLLIPLGADIGAKNRKVKNPLSPYWSLIIDDSFFLDLTMWKDFLSKPVNEDEMKRRAAIHRVTDVDGNLSESMFAWNTVLELIRVATRDAVACKCPVYAAAFARQATYEAWLLSQIKDKAIAVLKDEAVTHRILRKQCRWRAKNRKTPQVSHCNTGRDALVNAMEGHDLATRLQRAGSNTAAGQRKVSIDLMAAHILAVFKNGLPLIKSEIIKTVKSVSRSTAYTVYDDAFESVRDAIGYIANPCTTTSSTLPRLASQVIRAPDPASSAQRPVLRAPQQAARAAQPRLRWARRPVIRDNPSGLRSKYDSWSPRHRQSVLQAMADVAFRHRIAELERSTVSGAVGDGIGSTDCIRDPATTLH
jgi:hypothetical protein